MTDENGLSERELEILKLVATGASNKEIAQQLVISPNTVKVHLRNIFSKIGVVSRTEATLYALRIGLISAPQVDRPVPQEIDQSENKESLPPPVDQPERPFAENQFPRSRITILRIGLALLFVIVLVLSVVVWNDRIQSVEIAQPTPSLNISRWQIGEPFPSNVSGMAAERYETRIYLIGGAGVDGPSSEVWSFSSTETKWQTHASKPTPVMEIHAALLGEKIYIPGGLQSNGKPTDVLEVYDPRDDTWTRAANLPIPLSGYAQAAFEGRLYLFGGWDGVQIRNSVLMYDPLTDQWEQREAMPTALQSAGAAVLGNKIFLFGGKDKAGPLTNTWIYYPNREAEKENPWEAGLALPQARYSMGITAMVDAVYLMGGMGKSDETLPSLRFVPQQNVYQEIDPPIQQFHGEITLVPLDTQIHVFGGIENTSLTTGHQIYQAIYTVAIPAISR